MARYSSGRIVYEFEELQIVPDHGCWVNGEAEVTYEWEPDDYDTGYKGGFELEIGNIKLYGTTKEAKGLDLPKSSPLYQLIEIALLSDKYAHHIVFEIEGSLW